MHDVAVMWKQALASVAVSGLLGCSASLPPASPEVPSIALTGGLMAYLMADRVVVEEVPERRGAAGPLQARFQGLTVTHAPNGGVGIGPVWSF